MADLERAKIKVGFIPIIDCAAIVLAEELGAYERQGLEVEIRREVSWANVRDKLALGVLDASHILAPLPLAQTLGIDSVTPYLSLYEPIGTTTRSSRSTARAMRAATMPIPN